MVVAASGITPHLDGISLPAVETGIIRRDGISPAVVMAIGISRPGGTSLVEEAETGTSRRDGANRLAKIGTPHHRTTRRIIRLVPATLLR